MLFPNKTDKQRYIIPLIMVQRIRNVPRNAITASAPIAANT